MCIYASARKHACVSEHIIVQSNFVQLAIQTKESENAANLPEIQRVT